MNHRTLLAIISCSLIATGCGRYVSSKQFINTSMTKDAKLAAAANTQVYAFVRSSDRVAPDVQPYRPSPVVIQSGNRGGALGLDLTSQRGRMTYASEVRNEVDSLQRDLARISSRATQKGPAAQAALAPEYRSFVNNVQSIDNQIDRIGKAGNHHDALVPKSRVDALLDDVRADVRRAADAVDSTPAAPGSSRP